MSVKDALKAYCDLAADVFSDKKQKWKGETFSAAALENAMKKTVMSCLENSDEKMLVQSEEHCRTYVVWIRYSKTNEK